jgi:hypothetical protein
MVESPAPAPEEGAGSDTVPSGTLPATFSRNTSEVSPNVELGTQITHILQNRTVHDEIPTDNKESLASSQIEIDMAGEDTSEPIVFLRAIHLTPRQARQTPMMSSNPQVLATPPNKPKEAKNKTCHVRALAVDLDCQSSSTPHSLNIEQEPR